MRLLGRTPSCSFQIEQRGTKLRAAHRHLSIHHGPLTAGKAMVMWVMIIAAITTDFLPTAAAMQPRGVHNIDEILTNAKGDGSGGGEGGGNDGYHSGLPVLGQTKQDDGEDDGTDGKSYATTLEDGRSGIFKKELDVEGLVRRMCCHSTCVCSYLT